MKHTVKQGDCISSIAVKYGFFPDTLWNHAENAQLKQKRKEPNVLFPGDEVFIPDKREKTEICATEQRHRFRKKGVPERLRIVVLDENDEPRRNASYLLTIDGENRRGTTNSEGLVDEPIPPNAKKGELAVGEGEEVDEYELELGNLDPPDQASGIQGRLANLGFDAGPADGRIGPWTKKAIEQFQQDHGLEPTGEPDKLTQQKLEEVDRA